MSTDIGGTRPAPDLVLTMCDNCGTTRTVARVLRDER